MTWIVALRSWNHAIALFDTQVTSAQGPERDFGLMKLQGIAYNAVAGFAGSVAIGLDVLNILHKQGEEHQRALGSDVKFGIELQSYGLQFVDWLRPTYEHRYSQAVREQGLELLVLAALPTAAAPHDVLADLTQGLKITFPRPSRSDEFSVVPIDFISPVSIGSGAAVPEYMEGMQRMHDRMDEFRRKLDDPDQHQRFAQFAYSRAQAMTPLLETVLREHPESTVGQQLFCSVVTPEGLWGPFFQGGWAKNRQVLLRRSEVSTFLRERPLAAATLLG